jgi:hypothetical protein
MSELVIQTADNAVQIWSGDPAVNYSTSDDLTVGLVATEYRGLHRFDFSALPVPAVIYDAVIGLYKIAGPGGDELDVFRILRADMNLAQATWNSFKTSNAWGTAGASNATDVTGADSVVGSYGANNNWTNLTVTNMVRYAHLNTAKVLYARLHGENAQGSFPVFHSSHFAGDASLRPKLTITYRVPSTIMIF